MKPIDFVIHLSAVEHPYTKGQYLNCLVTNSFIKSLNLSVPRGVDICDKANSLYYGKISCNLINRCREHLGVNKDSLRIRGSPSAIGDYINQSGHAALLKDFSILDRANNEFDLLIHESLLILRDRSELNSEQSSIPLVLL